MSLKRKRSSDNTATVALASNQKIIVGVDYGTTYTGVSYVSSKGAECSDISIIETWPGPARETESVTKVPSRIAYPVDNPGMNGQQWGYQVQAGMTACSWTKLLLDRNAPLTRFDDPALQKRSGGGILRLPQDKEAIDVAADFLSEIYKYTLERIAKHTTEDTLRVTPLEFWFTVPAIWSDQALNATMTAARRAGFGESITRPEDKIFLLPEPEAAAIAALKKCNTSGIGGLVKPGDGVLVCDCGGGTVDLTSYLVVRTSPALAFEELCAGAGGKCGSTAVDRNFYQLMSERFGDAFNNLPMKRKCPGSEFMSRFEIIKRDFGHSYELTALELPLNMTVPNHNPKYFDEEERRVIISSKDLLSVFEPVVDQILGLVNLQIEDARQETGKDIINRIILVGGFGDSEYLRKAFRSSFEPRGIAVTVPNRPQAAIVQGAALRGLEGLRPIRRKCRRHYGFHCGLPFRDGIDDEFNSYIDEWNGLKYCGERMDWMVAKGEEYIENYTFSSRVEATHFENDWRNSDTYLVGNIIVDLSAVDLSQFESKLIYRSTAYLLKYQIKVTFSAQAGLLKFEATSQGKTVGQTSISFNANKYY